MNSQEWSDNSLRRPYGDKQKVVIEALHRRGGDNEELLDREREPLSLEQEADKVRIPHRAQEDYAHKMWMV